MTTNIDIEPLTVDAFSPFGDLIDSAGEPTKLINNGLCERYNDRIRLDFDERGRAGVSVLYGQPYALPYTFDLVERHPLGSQAFIPMMDAPFLVIVAHDEHGVPGTPRAFLTPALRAQLTPGRSALHHITWRLLGNSKSTCFVWVSRLSRQTTISYSRGNSVCS